ncbi:MAG: preprotein translocase subunit SecG [Magnetococcales bacterium]|nr:preprotein translocase subunit SecG [Magnetococcales bacterium]
MSLIITVIHIMAALALIFVVLLQRGSGADMGAAFGGSSQSVFGAQGSGNFMTRLTAILATVFMITSLSLAFFTTQKSAGTTVMEDGVAVEEKATKEAPVVPTEPELPSMPVPAKGGEFVVPPPAVESAVDSVPLPTSETPLPPQESTIPEQGSSSGSSAVEAMESLASEAEGNIESAVGAVQKAVETAVPAVKEAMETIPVTVQDSMEAVVPDTITPPVTRETPSQ